MTEFYRDDYVAAVELLADEIVEQYLDLSYDNDYHDLLCEIVEGSEYVTYTRYHQPILWYSRNADNAVDNGLLDGASTASEIIQTMAQFALEADVDQRARELLADIRSGLDFDDGEKIRRIDNI